MLLLLLQHMWRVGQVPTMGAPLGAPMGTPMGPSMGAPMGPTGGPPGGPSSVGGGPRGPLSWPQRGDRAPHEFYQDTKRGPTVRGLRWTPDPRVLHPELLKDFVGETVTPELSKERVRGFLNPN